MFLIWGTEEGVVDSRSQTLPFLEALEQADFRACVVHGAPHYWLSDPMDRARQPFGFVAPRLLGGRAAVAHVPGEASFVSERNS